MLSRPSRQSSSRAGRARFRVAALLAAVLALPVQPMAQDAGTPVLDANRSLPAEVLDDATEPLGWVGDRGALGLLPGDNAAAQPAPAGTAAPAADPAAGPQGLTPVVVELFTAQGCSSCPPADALLGTLGARADVLPLSFHVDYWDYLGWADAFAQPAFTARQRAYAARTGERAVWTPQMVVGGTDTLIDLTPAALDQLIAAHREQHAPLAVTISRDKGAVTLQVTRVSGHPQPATVQLLRYLPQRSVEIRAGENRGRRAESYNIVVGVESLATWDGRAPLRLVVRLGAGGPQALPADTRHAILVQEQRDGLPGAVLAALPLD